MTIKNTVSKIWKSLFAVEKISIVYAFATAIFIILFGTKENNTAAMLLYRALFIALMFVLRYMNNVSMQKLIWFVRSVFPLALIAYWYPETYYMNENIFSNLDHLFVAADQWLFGCQPSLLFSSSCHQLWISELMHFGYISYYFVIAAAVFVPLMKGREFMQQSAFLILCSFFIYYITFIILPVTGPQFYFSSPDNLLDVESGVFRNMLVTLQNLGEKPTGAFPSSHVGICIICMWIIFKHSRKIFYVLVPVALILICSTVYIKAHYLTDVIGGLISAPAYLWISSKILKKSGIA